MPGQKKHFARNSGARNGCANFMGVRDFLFLSAGELQENLHAHKILVLGGGGSANFIFIGVGIGQKLVKNTSLPVLSTYFAPNPRNLVLT